MCVCVCVCVCVVCARACRHAFLPVRVTAVRAFVRACVSVCVCARARERAGDGVYFKSVPLSIDLRVCQNKFSLVCQAADSEVSASRPVCSFCQAHHSNSFCQLRGHVLPARQRLSQWFSLSQCRAQTDV